MIIEWFFIMIPKKETIGMIFCCKKKISLLNLFNKDPKNLKNNIITFFKENKKKLFFILFSVIFFCTLLQVF